MRLSLTACLFLSLLSCAGLAPEESEAHRVDFTRPYALVLGTAQDGGSPQVGCDCERCATALAEPGSRRLVSSLLLAAPASGQRYLFDASPDLTEQVELARGHPPTRVVAAGRPPLFEGLFLTHAHMGHYTGLFQLGREAYGAEDLKVHGTERLCAFFRSNDPWAQMVSAGHLALHPLEPGAPRSLTDDLTVTALLVPHRDEYSDTVGFVIRSSRAALLYLPDIDKWERWVGTNLEDVLASVDFALIDGTFFAAGEIPGRAMDEIPHPFIAESMARFGSLPAAQRAKIYFTHFNHTNPVSDEASPEARAVLAAGFHLAREGQVFEL